MGSLQECGRNLAEDKGLQAMTPQQVAETLLGRIEWEGNSTGFCICPGFALHTGKDRDRDTQVFIEGAPTIHCFHDSCNAAVAEANFKLRQAIGKEDGTVEKLDRPARAKAKAKQSKDIGNAKKMLRRIMEQRWHPADMFEDSPYRLLEDSTHDWRRLLALFEEDDVVWIGDVTDSGDPSHASHFRKRKVWEREENCPGAFTCPTTFTKGSYRRSKSNVERLKYLVVESDELEKDEIGAVFRWLNKFLPLYAVVDTAGKSLHGWFEYPPTRTIPVLKQTLVELGCDGKMFTQSQPCRLPSAKRGKLFQSLLFYAPDGFQR